MLLDGVKYVVTRYFILAALILALIFLSKDSTKALFASSQASRDSSQLPIITRLDQGNAPLRIVDSFVETPSPEKTVVRVMVQNQGDKPIRALAIAADVRVVLINLSGAASILTPSQIKTYDIVYTGEERPKTINLSVDFVEFRDGTTWGIDIANSRDRLAGQREGAKAERQRLKSIFKTKGEPALTELLGSDDRDEHEATIVINHSREWQLGYSSGVAAIRYRLRLALQTGNQEQLELELDKAYDSSEENQ